MKKRLSALSVFLVVASAACAQEEVYHLGFQDRIRLHVHEWPVLTGEFTIGPDGRLMLPLVGEVVASGLQPSELAAVIAERLQTKAQLSEPPDTSLAVTQYRPFYILGGVEKPGEYAYRPGMLVLNALTIAGGVYRPPRSSEWGFERDSISGRGEIRLILLRREELLAKEARLKAEASGQEEFVVSKDSEAGLSRFIEEERKIFYSRLNRHKNQINALADTLELLDREIASVQAQIAAAELQRQSVARELDDTKGMVSRGLAPAPRVLPLERTLAQIVREQKEMETSILRARQQINQARLQRTGLLDERRSVATLELQALLVQLRELDERYETTSRLAAGALSAISAPQSEADEESGPPLTFTLIRKEHGEVREISATESTRILPDDIVKVFRPQESKTRKPRAVQPQLGSNMSTSDGRSGTSNIR
jgi:exopolysaccharide production protein ExoF